MTRNNYMSRLFFIFGLICVFSNVHAKKCRRHSTRWVTVINCNHLRISDLDSNIASTNEQVILNIANCSGTIDEGSFANIKHVKFLNIDNCALDKFVLPALHDLKSIDIRNSVVPKITRNSLKNAISLRHITFSSNVMVIQKGAFEDLSLLITLDVNKQNVTLEREFLKGLRGLGLLSLTDTAITTVPKDTFEDVPDMLDLDLSKNPIEKIEHGALDPLKKLINLSILDNQMQKLDVQLFKQTKNLDSLRAPAKTLKNFNLQKFLEYCPVFSYFDFSMDDCGTTEVAKFQQLVKQFDDDTVSVYFDGISRPDRC